jgi:hypothetical protein
LKNALSGANRSWQSGVQRLPQPRLGSTSPGNSRPPKVRECSN